MMNYTNICNYDGSFYEWDFNGTNPIQTGFPLNSPQFRKAISYFDPAKAVTAKGSFVK